MTKTQVLCIDEPPIGMESSKALPLIGSEGVNPVPRLSVEQFLHSLARTPAPTRFHRRRERLLKQSLKVSQEMKNVRDGGHSTNSETRPGKHDRAARDRIVTAGPQLDVEKCRHMSNDELGTPIVGNASHLASNVLFNLPADVIDQAQLDNMVEGNNNNDTDLLIRQTSIAPDELLRPHRHHQHHNSGDGNSMFVRANMIDEFEESQSTGRAKLGQREGEKITPDTPIRSDLEIVDSRSRDERENSTHEVQDDTDTPAIGDTKYVAVQSSQNVLQLAIGKFGRPTPKPKKKIKIYGNRKSLYSEQPRTETKIPRMLPVEELQITVDRAPSNSIHNPESEAADHDDDPVDDFSPFPCQDSGRMPRQRKVTKMTRKRKPLNEIQQTILKPKADDLYKYMLPNNGDMSPNTRKRLKISMSCSDGFEGSEGLPTGRTMPVKLPRRYTQVVCQAMVYVPELTLVSSRDCTENITGLSELQSEDFYFSEVAKCNHLEFGTVMEELGPVTEKLPESLQDSKTVIKQPGSSQLGILKSGTWPVHSGDDHVKKNMGVVAPVTIRRSSRRVTFSDNTDVVQTFRMISAPIIMKSGSDSMASESSATDEDEEYDYQDSSGSSDEVESERDDYQSIEDGKCGDDRVEAFDLRCIPLAPIKTTFQIARHFKYRINDEDQSPRRLVRNDQLRGKCTDGIDLTINSRNAPHVQPSEKREEMLTADASRSQNMAAEGDHWRPRIPITSSRLIEVDDEILEYPISPNPATHQSSENLQQGKRSQVSIELGDPKWRVLYNNGYEQSCSQDGNLDSPQEELRCYIFEEQPPYLARALESFSNASPRDPALARSKSVPAEQSVQERYPTGSLTINSVFRSTVSPQNRHLSKAKNTGLGISTRSISVGAGAIPAWKRIRQLPLIPPFLRD